MIDLPGSGSVGLAVFFLIGLLGGAHCLGMCGPLVTLYSNRLDATGSRHGARQHALFNLGRTGSYAAIGALMGALGALLFDAADVASVAAGVRATVGVSVGAAIMVVGANYALTGSTGHHVSVPVPGVGSLFSRAYGAITGRVDDWVRGPRIVALGALHGLLPCPILYPAFLYALATGSPVRGGVSLGLLGLGTVPTLFVYGTLVRSIDTATRVRLHRVLGVLFIVLGYLPLAMGLMALGVGVPHPSIPIYQPLG